MDRRVSVPESARAVTVDLHSTLVFYDVDDVEQRHRIAYQVIARHMELPVFEEFQSVTMRVRSRLLAKCEEEQIEITIADRLSLSLQEMGQTAPDPELVAQAADAYIEKWIDALWAPEGLANDLERLRGRYRLGLITNFGHGPGVPRILERFGLVELFDAVVVSADLGVRKPHPLMFRRGLEMLDCPPSEGIHVGDDIAADVEGARSVGMFPVLLDARNVHPEHPGARIKSIRELALALL
jgi:putative hydrolase of the HAD superfamily